jgi:hypothetical protein
MPRGNFESLNRMGKSTMAMPIVPINALFDDELRASLSADYLTFIQEADVIFGVDVMSEREFLLYGRAALEQVAASGEAKPIRVFRVSLDQETDDLEKLIALVQALRGSSDYKPDAHNRADDTGQ